jgi:cytochrome c2
MDGPPQEAPAPAPPERTLDLADDEPGRPHLRGRQNWVGAGVGLVALALAALVLSASYNRIPVTPDPGRQTGLPADGPSTLTALAGADPRRAPALFRSYGCVSCHVIPGVSGASGRVGPNLAHLYDHALIAGVLANTPENLLLWIRAPRQVDPNTGMPNLGVSTKDARDIAAYLQTLLQGRGRHD